MNKLYNIKESNNVIGQNEHRNYIELQAAFVIAQRGGSRIPGFAIKHSKRVSADINLLGRVELKGVIFNESIFSN